MANTSTADTASCLFNIHSSFRPVIKINICRMLAILELFGLFTHINLFNPPKKPVRKVLLLWLVYRREN